MAQGAMPPRARLWPLQRGSVSATPDVQAFGSEMVVGAKPDQPRPFTAPRSPMPLSQTTHVAATFSPEMAQGFKPDARPELRPAFGWNATPPDVDRFDSAMVQGWYPSKPRLFFAPRLEEALTAHTHVTAFSQEQVHGSKPDRFREFLPVRTGWSSAQLTHVAAAFSPEMVSGYHPDMKARQDLRLNIGWVTPDLREFSNEMVYGWVPASPRLFLAPRLPLPWSQPTHVPAAFSPEMAQGWRPEALPDLRPRFGWWTASPDVNPFSVEMALGSRPDRPRLFASNKGALSIAQLTHVQNAFTGDMIQGAGPGRNRERLAPRSPHTFTPPEVFAFSVEMALGSRPERARLFLAPRLPLPWAQTTHVANAFSPDMVAGWRPDRQAYADLRVRTGLFAQMIDVPFTPEMIQGWHPDRPKLFLATQLPLVAPPDVSLFSVEMVIGYRPDTPRLFYAPRFYQAPAQLTHVQNAFTIDMVRGSSPERNRQFLPPRSPYVAIPPDVFAFSIEMVRGARPDKPVLLLGAKIPLPLSQTTHVQNAFTQSMVTGERGQRFRERLGPKTYGAIPPDVVPFTIEMAIGSRPDRARIFLAPRFQQPPSQPTHVQATFTPSMSQGAQPPRNREYLPVKIAWQVSQPTPVDVISPDQFAGSHPDRSRDWLPIKLGWMRAQTTHDDAPFSAEMAQGATPDRPRLFLHPNPRLFRYHWGDELKTLTFVIADIVIDLSASAIALHDLPASAILVLDMDGSVVSILDLSGSEDDD